jgi:glycosyl transferase family 2
MKQPEISCRQSAAMRSAKERLVSGWLRIWRRQKLQSRLSGTTVSVVLTSCGRPDLLIRTLDSFFRFNTYPVSQFIVVEDGPTVLDVLFTYPFPCPHDLICTGERVGQIAAIDYAYSRVNSEYIFHLEDDWEFYAPHFIEKSMILLERHPKCLQVYLRAVDDTNGHPVARRIHKDDHVRWRRIQYGFVALGGEWNGFSFNPGLRRMADYVAIGGGMAFMPSRPRRSMASPRSRSRPGTARRGCSPLYCATGAGLAMCGISAGDGRSRRSRFRDPDVSQGRRCRANHLVGLQGCLQ